MTIEEREEAARDELRALMERHHCMLVVNKEAAPELRLADGSLLSGGTRYVVGVQALPDAPEPLAVTEGV